MVASRQHAIKKITHLFYPPAAVLAILPYGLLALKIELFSNGKYLNHSIFNTLKEITFSSYMLLSFKSSCEIFPEFWLLHTEHYL